MISQPCRRRISLASGPFADPAGRPSCSSKKPPASAGVYRNSTRAVSVLVFLVVVFVYALAAHFPILHRWIDRPYLFVFPAIGAIAAIVLAHSILRHNDDWPFYMVALIFVSAFGTLALSFWPYLIPFVITIDEAAAPQSSLMFMFWGGVVVFPLMLVYTLVSYSVFRGKIRTTTVHY